MIDLATAGTVYTLVPVVFKPMLAGCFSLLPVINQGQGVGFGHIFIRGLLFRLG